MSTQSEVIAILDSLAAAHQEIPPLRDIRRQLGRGSLTTISRAVQSWKATHKSDDPSAFPTELTDIISNTLLQSIWEGVRPLMEERIQAQAAVQSAQLEQLRAELNVALKSLDESKAQCGELEREVRKLTDELQIAILARARAEGALEALRNLREVE